MPRKAWFFHQKLFKNGGFSIKKAGKSSLFKLFIITKHAK